MPVENQSEKTVIEELKIGQLEPSKFNRTIFSPLAKADATELKNSIKENGLIEPLVVRPSQGKMYEILCGEERFKIVSGLDWKTVPCIIRNDLSDDGKAHSVLIEDNLRRRQNSPADTAKAIAALADIKGVHATKEASEKFGMSQRHAQTLAKVGGKLNKEWMSVLKSEKISLKSASALAGMEHDIQEKLYRAVITKGKESFGVDLEKMKDRKEVEKELKSVLKEKNRLEEQLKKSETAKEVKKSSLLDVGLARQVVESFTSLYEKANQIEDIEVLNIIDEALSEIGYTNV